MADIEMVIKIPEELFGEINDENYQSKISWYGTTLYCAIKDGTPLPKGHGRIVDIGPYEGKVIASRKYCGVNRLVEVAELDTIIEAESKG